MITGIRNEIYRLIDTVPALGSRIFYQQAPDGTALPYCAFFQTASNVFEDTASVFGDSYVQISVFSDVATQAESIAQSLNDVFVKATSSFTVAGYNITLCTVQSRRSLLFDDVHQSIIEIQVSFEKE